MTVAEERSVRATLRESDVTAVELSEPHRDGREGFPNSKPRADDAAGELIDRFGKAA